MMRSIGGIFIALVILTRVIFGIGLTVLAAALGAYLAGIAGSDTAGMSLGSDHLTATAVSYIVIIFIGCRGKLHDSIAFVIFGSELTVVFAALGALCSFLAIRFGVILRICVVVSIYLTVFGRAILADLTVLAGRLAAGMLFGSNVCSTASVILIVLISIGGILRICKFIACVIVGIKRSESVSVLSADSAGCLLKAGCGGLDRMVFGSDYLSAAGVYQIVHHNIDCRGNEYLGLGFVMVAVKLAVVLATNIAYCLI